MKLIGNSVSVPVVEKLVSAICATGVFADPSIGNVDVDKSIRYPLRRPRQLRLAIEKRKRYKGGAAKMGGVKVKSAAKAKSPKSVRARCVKQHQR